MYMTCERWHTIDIPVTYWTYLAVSVKKTYGPYKTEIMYANNLSRVYYRKYNSKANAGAKPLKEQSFDHRDLGEFI